MSGLAVGSPRGQLERIPSTTSSAIATGARCPGSPSIIHHDDSELLWQSAALSAEQHQKLRKLADDLDAAEARSLAALDTHIAEMTRLADENKALRIQLSTITAEVAGLAQSEAASESALNSLQRKLELAERGILEREERLHELLPLASQLPGENFRLTKENQELLGELEHLKERLASIEPTERLEEVGDKDAVI